MATDKNFIEYVHEQIGLESALTYRKMFGEYGLYFDGKIVAVVADNRLFLKPTTTGRALLPAVIEAPPYPGAKTWFLMDEWLDDTDFLQRLIQVTAAELPYPKPKLARKSVRKRGCQ